MNVFIECEGRDTFATSFPSIESAMGRSTLSVFITTTTTSPSVLMNDSACMRVVSYVGVGVCVWGGGGEEEGLEHARVLAV
jgi:hypothetical protein